MARIIHESIKDDEIIIIMKEKEWDRYVEIEKLNLSIEEIKLIKLKNNCNGDK